MNATTLYLLGGALGILTGLLGLTTVVAVVLPETQTSGGFLFATLITGFAAGLLLLGFRNASDRMMRTDTTILLLLIWAILPAFAAIPFVVSGQFPTVVKAYFEAVSGLTTTGATTTLHVELLETPILFWRALLQWFGGALTLLTAVLVLAPFDAATGPTNSTIPGYEQGDLPKSIVATAQDIIPVYGALTSVILIGLWFTGLPELDALIYAFSAISTGGFTSSNAGLAAYDAPAAEVIVCLGMILGATSFLAHRTTFLRFPSGGHLDTRESLIMLVAIPLAGAALTAIYWGQDEASISAFRVGFFQAVSLLTTSGLDNAAAGVPATPFVFALAMVAIGGAAFSTAGGVKLFRVSTMIVQAHRELKRLIHPRGISSARAAGKAFDIQIMKSIWALFVVFLAAAGALALLLGWQGTSYENAIMASIAALSNAGPVLGMSIDGAIGPSAGYEAIPPLSLLGLAAGMILGKVEFLTVLGLFGWWWHSLRV